MILQRVVLASAAGFASVFLLAACGVLSDNASGTSPDSGSPIAATTPDPAAGTQATSAPAASAPPASAPADGRDSGNGQAAMTTMLTAKVMTGTDGVVTDDRGMTLYRYGRDQASPSKWTCAGACTKTWIPVLVQDSIQTDGVEKSLLGTVHRNGMKQLTLAGWPLYRYVGDTKAGETNGQGREKEWYAVTPSGRKSALTG
ncbi:hypothetical protein QA943_01130 [Streptomyces sp. B21-097]|uniref:hypothetical protein n=1 Tax=Streptomyces sp. B21-097 TaxID=3039414 RepID=UPI002FF13B55